MAQKLRHQKLIAQSHIQHLYTSTIYICLVPLFCSLENFALFHSLMAFFLGLFHYVHYIKNFCCVFSSFVLFFLQKSKVYIIQLVPQHKQWTRVMHESDGILLNLYHVRCTRDTYKHIDFLFCCCFYYYFYSRLRFRCYVVCEAIIVLIAPQPVRHPVKKENRICRRK